MQTQHFVDSPVVLVDILHDDQKEMLVSPKFGEIFESKVLSNLTPTTKICVEGINTGIQGIPPDHFNYNYAIEKLWPTSKSAYKPTLYGADPRSLVGFLENQKLLAEVLTMLSILDNCLTVTEKPQSINEAIDWIKNDNVHISLSGSPTREVKNLADKIYRLEKTWIKNYGDLAKKCLLTSKKVYIVAGLTHIIGLHVKYGWPIMWLTKDDPTMTPEFVYRSGMNFTQFLDVVRRLEAAKAA